MSAGKFLHGDNVVVAEADQDRGSAALAESAIRAAREAVLPTAPALPPLRAIRAALEAGVSAAPAAATAKPYRYWWRVEIGLHSGKHVIRNTLRQPAVKEILEAGWYERAENGDEFVVGYDAIATVKTTRLEGPMTGATS